jgi:hypothetical protein
MEPARNAGGRGTVEAPEGRRQRFTTRHDAVSENAGTDEGSNH